MNLSLKGDAQKKILARLTKSNQELEKIYPGDVPLRQPVHTVYGGAHLFKKDTLKKLGTIALSSLNEYAPDPLSFGEIFELEDQALCKTVYDRVLKKLQTQAVEDFRIDFEDGFGYRPDSEEDLAAEKAALETVQGIKEESLSPFFGIRVKSLSQEAKARSLRTLDIYLSTLTKATSRRLPEQFVITLPKVMHVGQVSAFVEALKVLEVKLKLKKNELKLELMIETPQSLMASDGSLALMSLVRASQGRCRGVHFGAYDYTALLQITSDHQALDHAACDFAREFMQVGLAGTGIWLSDGATNILPIPPYKAPATESERNENREKIHQAWRLAFDNNDWSLRQGFYQGWDLHPAQLVSRYAALYSFFHRQRLQATARLKSFMEKAAQASSLGNVFDDAASGQGLLNFFLRGLSCGALTEQEALETGLSFDELQSRSFMKILEARKGKKSR